jgi:hypothetical protein
MHAGHVIGALCLAVIPTVLAQSYSLSDTFVGRHFLDAWKWETMDDPTHGRVNYVDQPTAINANLSFGMSPLSIIHFYRLNVFFLYVPASDTKFVMRAESHNIVPATARGRDSIRISSNAAYDDAVFVLDLAHMPQGCATWPAWWTVSSSGPWPQGGEIDIIEGESLRPFPTWSFQTDLVFPRR